MITHILNGLFWLYLLGATSTDDGSAAGALPQLLALYDSNYSSIITN